MWANRRAEFQNLSIWLDGTVLTLWPVVARTWKKNTVGHTALFILLSMTGPKFCQIYSKMMIVYCARVNLHTELVKMDSSWMSVLTRRLHKGTRLSTIDGMIIFFRELAKCTFCSETVAKILIMWPFKSLPTTPPWKVILPKQHKIMDDRPPRENLVVVGWNSHWINSSHVQVIGKDWHFH